MFELVIEGTKQFTIYVDDDNGRDPIATFYHYRAAQDYLQCLQEVSSSQSLSLRDEPKMSMVMQKLTVEPQSVRLQKITNNKRNNKKNVSVKSRSVSE